MGTTNRRRSRGEQDGPVLWDEVQGVDAAKESWSTVAEWLKDPKASRLSAPERHRRAAVRTPGTGKTMLAARSPAHAGVDSSPPSGSSFSRCSSGVARPAFAALKEAAAQAERRLIDELDRVGGHRGSGAGDGGTLGARAGPHQLLVELDGFERDPGP